MCGIAGYFLQTPANWSIDAMVAQLGHRGPDGRGTWTTEGHDIALGQTRLSIIDLAGGAQPMASWDGRYCITFNGEIYNYVELRAELDAVGHRFCTHSDTEVIIEGYRRWGADCLKRMHGMFALTLYDKGSGEIFVARDRTGIKPLYYYDDQQRFAFASEIKGLFALPGIPRRMDLRTLVDFLVLGYPLWPRTMFADIREFPPGHYLRINGRKREWGRYWNWQHRPQSERVTSEDEALRRIREALIASVREHLVADVPVGAQLSGGIDSSLIAAIVTKDLGRKINTYTVSFDEASFDESPVARETARLLGTNHNEVHLSRGGIDLVARVIDQFDQPFADSSAIPSWLLSAEIRKSCKVVLSGDGGDEMFGGYPRFAYADVAKRLGPFVSPISGLIESCLPYLLSFKPELLRGARRIVRAAAGRNGDRLVALSCYVWPAELPAILAPGLASELESSPVFFPREEVSDDPGGENFVDATVRHVLPGDYLRKVDVTSSAHGLEVRVPFLGEHILECSSAIDNGLKYNLRSNKRLLRRLAADYLPKIVTEKAKSGFGIPLDKWISPADRYALCDSLCSPDSALEGIIAPGYRREILTGFATGNWDEKRHSRYMIFQKTYQLWCLERWLGCWKPSNAQQ